MTQKSVKQTTKVHGNEEQHDGSTGVGGHLTYLVVPIRPLLGWLGWSWLCCSVAPILLTLTLRIIRILRTWTTLGRTCKTVTPTNGEQSRVRGGGRS